MVLEKRKMCDYQLLITFKKASKNNKFPKGLKADCKKESIYQVFLKKDGVKKSFFIFFI